MADLEVGDLSRADSLSGVSHLIECLMDGTLEWSGSTSDVLCFCQSLWPGGHVRMIMYIHAAFTASQKLHRGLC